MHQRLQPFAFQEQTHQAILEALYSDGLQANKPYLEAQLAEDTGRDRELGKTFPLGNAQTLNGIIQTLSNRFSDQPPVQQALAELVMTTDSLADQLGLTALQGSDFVERLNRVTDGYLARLQTFLRQQHIRSLASEARQLEQHLAKPVQELPAPEPCTTEEELSMLELQYQLRDKLIKPA